MLKLGVITEQLEPTSWVTDDILVYGSSVDEHDQRLNAVLERARSMDLKLNESKSKICHTEVPYIGHILTSEGVKPDPERLQAIIDMPIPCDKASGRQFLGMAGYVHKFIPNMSDR